MRIIKIFISLILLVIGGSLFYFYKINKAPADLASVRIFVVQEGMGVNEISRALGAEKLIESAWIFGLYVRLEKLSSALQAGTYKFDRPLSVKQIVERLAAGQTVNNELKITIPEGWTIDSIDEYLAGQEMIKAGDFSRLAKRPVSDWVFEIPMPGLLDSVPRGVDLEGYLYPDTYQIYRDASVHDIIEKMLVNLDRKLTLEIRKAIDDSGKSIHEIMTLASIIEKEVRLDADREIVAGILYKRLATGMRLELDSTINYITGKNDPSAQYIDLEVDSPYNTYKNYGLPPGPISNPGIKSIEAAIFPKSSEYLFYLNRQDTGETIFSINYDEHLRNKQKYLK